MHTCTLHMHTTYCMYTCTLHMHTAYCINTCTLHMHMLLHVRMDLTPERVTSPAPVPYTAYCTSNHTLNLYLHLHLYLPPAQPNATSLYLKIVLKPTFVSYTWTTYFTSSCTLHRTDWHRLLYIHLYLTPTQLYSLLHHHCYLTLLYCTSISSCTCTPPHA